MKSSKTPVSNEPVADPARLQITGRLFGRDQAIQSLLNAFEQVCRGSGKVQLVAGHSGAGKTVLVQEVREPVGRSNGFFLDGKFNQYQQDVPYFAFRQALKVLCRKIALDDDMQRKHWKAEILQAVGNFGQLLVDLIPEIESIIGKQPPVADISPLEARHRFAGVFREFLKAVCRPEHPVVLFLDDWQWADAASLDLLTKLQVDTALRYLLVIVSYRDDEVDPAHPLVAAVEELRRRNVPVEVLDVKNLALEEIRALLADELKPEVESLDRLAALVYRCTEGNPFFTRSLIEFLYSQGLLRYEQSLSCWLWSPDEISGSDLPSDVVDLFARKLGKLEPATRELLSRAACLGNRFDLETLAIISDRSVDQCRLMIEGEATQGLVLPAGGLTAPGNYIFLHDRVQQAAYGFIRPAELTEVRLEIGRRLLEHLSPEQLAERIFQVADHLNAGYLLIQNPDEQVGLVKLNVQAARKARDATAYRTTLQFQRAAARFLERPGFSELLWEKHHDLAMQLFLAWAEGEFLEGDRNVSEHCVRQAVSHASGSIERAEALNILIVQFTLLARYPEAIAAGREALAELGIMLPDDDYEAARDMEIEQVRRALKGRHVADLLQLPVMSNPEMRTAVKLLITMGPPCYRSHQRLWSVIVPKVVNLTIRYGNMPQIGYSHTAFGGLLGWVDNDYATAKEFGDLATKLMTSTFDSPSDQSVFYLMIGSSLRHWFEHLKSGSRDYALAYETGLRSGNLQYAAYAFGHNMYCRFYQGTQLPELIQESKRSLDFSRTRVNQWAIDLLEGGLRIFGYLAGSIDDDEAWESDYLRHVDEHHNIQVRCIYQELRAFSLLMLGQYEGALAWSDKVEPLVYTVGSQGLLPWPEHVFARSLIISALYPDATPDRQAAWHGELERMLEQLGIWAGSCPENFAHKHALAAGEIARVDGRVFTALRFYHQAAESAAAGGFVQWEGLANERAAALLETCGLGRMATVYRQQAYGCYHRWGATRKLQTMETACREYLSTDIHSMVGHGVEDDVLDQKLLSQLLEKQIQQLRTQSAESDYANLQKESARKSQELAEGAERLRVEVAERKNIEMQLQQHREHLEEAIKQRTAELEANRNQLLEARAEAFKLMEEAIAARDRAEAGREALNKSQQLLGETEQVGKVGGWEVNVDTGKVIWTAEVYNIHEVDVGYDLTVEKAIDFYTPASRPIIEQAVRRAFEHGEPFDVELEIVTAKGNFRNVHAIGKTDLEHRRVYGFFQDITERKQAEEALRKAHSELEIKVKERTGELEATNNELSAFVYTAYHVLRAPLRGINGFAHILLDEFTDSLNDEGRRLLKALSNNAIEINQYIDDLLAYSNIGRKEIKPTSVDTEDVVRSVISEFDPLVSGRKVKFEIRKLPPAYVDQQMIKQVFFNLLSNSVKFTRPKEEAVIEVGGITSENPPSSPFSKGGAQFPPLEKGGQGGFEDILANQNIYYVKDNGAGFDMQYKDKLFSVFQRLHGEEAFEGTGMGLAIVKRIIEKHGGRVWAEGKVNEGATFYFSLPLKGDYQSPVF